MPANPFFILFLLFLSFGGFSLLLKPLLNRDNRNTLAGKISAFYDINQTKPSEESDETTTQPEGDHSIE